MRDCVFVVADGAMQQALIGFLTRSDCFEQYNLGTKPFAFDPQEDVFPSAHQDGGTFSIGHELLRPFQTTHRHAVLMLDNKWDGSPGVEAIRDDLSARIVKTGWTIDRFRVIVIDPELEAWIWQRSQKVADVLKFSSVDSMVKAVRAASIEWSDDKAKPSRPKDALKAVATRQRGIGFSNAIHREICEKASVVKCQELSFKQLREALQGWFPLGAQT